MSSRSALDNRYFMMANKSRRNTLHRLHDLSHSYDLGTPAAVPSRPTHASAKRLHDFIKQLSTELEAIEASLEQPEIDRPIPEQDENLNEHGLKVAKALQEDRKPKEKGPPSSLALESPEDSDWAPFEKLFAKDLLPSPDAEKNTNGFLLELMKLLFDYIHRNNDRSYKVLDFHHPHQLLEMMDHCIGIPGNAQPLEQILSDCKETLKYCVKTGHPRFFNQLSTGLDMIAMAGEFLTAAANTNMFTYEIAPVFILMESILLERMRDIIGFEDGDGIFAPGGSMCNMYAILTARYRAFPDIKKRGLYDMPTLVLFTSEHTHFSFKKAAAVLGLGIDNVVAVKCDERGKMIPAVLEDKIVEARSQGKFPFFAVATGGTTVLGAFDPIPEIYDVCNRHGLWMHVDTAWGGGVLMSKRRRHLLESIESADSVTWNPHKMMGVTLQCAAFLTKHKDILAKCNSAQADYLFQQDKSYDVSWDTGDKSIQCGRHNDAFKLWLMWRAKGDEGFEAQIEHFFNLADHLRKKIHGRPGFRFVIKDGECTNVCFWYIPKSLRGLAWPEQKNLIHDVAPKIKGLMMEKGSTMVGYQPLGGLPNFFRVVFSNPASTTEDVDFLVNEIESLGEEIEITLPDKLHD